MSGQNRKISRTILDSSSGFATSRTHLTQPENELKQKLDAIDSSIKISNKKINKETRELRQILYDLQRDLKVSKSVSHYVPSPIEEQETKQAKRVRRVTVGEASQDLQLHRENLLKCTTQDRKTVEEIPEVTEGVSTKRRRKTSVPPIYKGKILVKDDDVFCIEDQGFGNTLSKEKKLELVDNEVGSLENKNGGVGSSKCERQEQTNKCINLGEEPCDDSVGLQDGAHLSSSSSRQQGSGKNMEKKSSYLSSSFLINNRQEIATEDDDIKSAGILVSHQGIRSLHHPVEMNSGKEISKGNASGTSPNVASQSRYCKGGRRRSSLTESEAHYRDTFKGRFVTHSLLQGDQNQSVLLPPVSEKRTRRITVAEINPGGARRRLDVGEIPVTPFYSASRRISTNPTHEERRRKSVSLGRGPTGGLAPRGGIDQEDMDNTLLASTAVDAPRYRRKSIRKVSCLPPLKEERTQQKTSTATAISNEWKNLENCRYLRKEDLEISIEDIFKKD